MNKPDEYTFVYITCSSLDEAKKIGKTILENKLAACLNIFPISSMYLLNETVHEALEFAIIVETRKDVFDELVKTIKNIHSYENPCICSFKVDDASTDFLKLIDAAMKI